MLKFHMPSLTLADFQRLLRQGFGDLLDYRVFLEKLRVPLTVLRLIHALAVFETEQKPKLKEFVESVRNMEEYGTARDRLFNAYRRFFLFPVQNRLDAALEQMKKDEGTQRTNAPTAEILPTGGEVAQ